MDAALELVRLPLQLDTTKPFQPFRTDIPDVLNTIDYYCLPSLWEGFPFGILEAMAMKKPVVASPVGGTVELVEHNKTGLLVDHGKPDELADMLLKLHNDTHLGKLLIENAYNKVYNNYGVMRLANEVQGLYNKFVG